MRTKYNHLFFDLDRTLWDFDRNSKEAITELFVKHDMVSRLGVDSEAFLNIYKRKNDSLWDRYRREEVKKDELRALRFYESFQHFGYDDAELGLTFNNEYVVVSSSKTNLVAGAAEMLEYLGSQYQLHVITNGFVEAQNRKLDNCDIRRYFKEVIISDGMGFKKPDKRIFHYAMRLAKAKSADSLMIGDDYGPDVLGAKSVGMDQVFFNRSNQLSNEATYTIENLKQMKDFL